MRKRKAKPTKEGDDPARSRKARAKGEGSVFQLPDGRWRGQVSNGFGPDGRRRRLIREGRTQEEVLGKIREALTDKDNGVNITPERKTVGQFLDQWIRDVVLNNNRPKTRRSYEDTVNLHLKPALGDIVLSKLKPERIQTFMNAKLAGIVVESKLKRWSEKSVRNYHGTLRSALGVAKRWGLIKNNPAELVQPPRVPKQPLRGFTDEEAKAFLRAIEGHRLEALFTVAVSLGLRQGECLGLQWPDIDFEKRTLNVQRSLAIVDGEFILGETKTQSSVRQLGIPAVSVSALAQHKRMQDEERKKAGDHWIETGFVFTTTVGTPIHQRNMLRDFYKIRETGKFPKVRFHDLRHSAGTLLSAQGIELRVVKEVLGHTDIRMTLKYGQVLSPAMRGAADAMDRVLKPVATDSGYVPKQVN